MNKKWRIKSEVEKIMESIVLKFVTSGDGGVGKTTLLNRFVNGKFLTDTKMTIGVDFLLKEIILNDIKVTLQLWDFTGQEHLRFMLEKYSYGSQGAFFMFDLNNISRSLRNVEIWWNLIRKHGDIPVLLVGTKYDLVSEIPSNRKRYKMFKNQIEDIITKYGFVDYIKTSSKTGQNVEEAIIRLTTYILKRIDY